LKADLAGYWSRRITEEHRLVYAATEEELTINACRHHNVR
jgi:toxin YoeB